MKPYHELTHRGQARRLRKLALNALRAYPLDVRKVSLLAFGFNAVFRVDTSDNRKYVLRANVPRGRSLDEISAEMHWLAALREDTDLVVPKPLANKQGALVTTANAPGVPEPRHCVVFGWVSGRDLYHQMTAENFRKLGVFTASLHNHAADFKLPSGLHIRKMDKAFYFEEQGSLWDESIPEDIVPRKRRALFQAVTDRTDACFKALYRTSGPDRLLHADLHQGNLRLYRGHMRALDFDDCMFGYPVQDLGITLYYIWGHPSFEQFREALYEGYTSLLPWPEKESGQLETVMAGRELILVNLLIHSDNASYKDLLPKFLARTDTRLQDYLEKFT